MVLYEGGAAKKELVFDASGTDKLNWFSAEKLTTSPWTDLTSQPRNYFTIQGDYHADGSGYRSFFISRSYGGCPSDDGWMATTQNTGWCSWDSTYKNKVVYSSLSTYTNWNSNGTGLSYVLIEVHNIKSSTSIVMGYEYVFLVKSFFRLFLRNAL